MTAMRTPVFDLQNMLSIIYDLPPVERIGDVGAGTCGLSGPYAETLGPVSPLILVAVEIEHGGVFTVGKRIGVLAHHPAPIVVNGDGVVAHTG